MLAGVERSTFRGAVDLILVDDESTLTTDGFAVFGVVLQLATALRTDECFVGCFAGGRRLRVGLLLGPVGCDTLLSAGCSAHGDLNGRDR